MPTVSQIRRAARKHEGALDPDWPITTLVSCDACGQRWSPNIRPGGRLPRRWWSCPNGCNDPQG